MFDTMIIHGSFGNQYENWIPWLRDALSKRGRNVLVPQFPINDDQNLENWCRVLDSYAPFLSPSVDVFAHSLGPAFIADYMIHRELTVGTAVLAVPFYSLLGNNEFDSVNSTFMTTPEAPAIFKARAKKVFCLYSDNDPYVPASLCEAFCREAGGESIIVPGGGHLNAAAGLSEFPQLLRYI